MPDVAFAGPDLTTFCLLDYAAQDQDKPLLVIIDGRDKRAMIRTCGWFSGW